ncbi:alpha/beta-hydrolase [Dentipellis sp. KUC8613]|nr:alpha/beta-hydrolase [Dentipellis sp. KUC8613]
MSSSPEVPFTIAIPDDALALLQQKLALTRLPDELDAAGWAYGAPLADVRRLVARWRGGYDWRAHEAQLNKELPMFTRDVAVDGFGVLNVHYVHQRSEVAAAVPLLFVHGWPGSFLEVRKILPLLTRASKEHPSFHVVAFSLPGYGFSEGVRKKGFTMPQYAELANKLMLALGYEEYVTQAGDWGHLITRYNAAMNGPKHVKAWHCNIAYPSPPSLLRNPLQILQYLLSWYSADERAGLERTKEWMKTGQGYMAEQSTKPQTLGYSLADSPVGLLAWIYEKLATWVDDYQWEDDEILTWISIYWFSREGPAASIRIYYEIIQAGQVENMPWSSIPLGLSRFPKEVAVLPRSWSRRVGNVVLEVSHDSGGHFAAHEKPEELVGDLRKMFGKGGPAFGAVPGKNGYV